MVVHPVNGIRLNVEERGSGEPLVLLHGFTGSAATWAGLQQRLAPRYRTFAVDLIGHGAADSPADPERYRMERCVEDLTALFDVLELDCPALLGYSLGGRVALHVALAAPERVGHLLLESASPGISEPGERAVRVRADEALAESIEREGLERFVDCWQSLPLWDSQRQLPAETRARLRVQRLANNPLGLANSLRGMGAGAMEPVAHRLEELQMPVQLVVGELDRKYCDLARSMVSSIPDARLAIVPNAGHTVHLEQPEAFERVVAEFLGETARIPSGARADS